MMVFPIDADSGRLPQLLEELRRGALGNAMCVLEDC